MNEQSFLHQSKHKVQTAILLLPAESNLYWQNLAGVPFLLRNTLILQKVGIKNLVIWMQHPSENMDANLRKLEQDPRVELEVECIVENNAKIPDPNVIVLDGSPPCL